MKHVDVLVIGGGIVGLAAAYQFTQRFSRHRLIVLEKESHVAGHQTGHNSGVLHSGIYYKPGSFKAQNCRMGKQAMQEFCAREGVDFEICGKVIVATAPHELAGLAEIYQRGQANGVRCELIDRDRLRKIEPYAAGLQAIHVPQSGIIDFSQVCARLASRIGAAGGEVITNAQVQTVHTTSTGIVVESTGGDFTSRYVINCAGLYSDRVTALSGQKPAAKIIPFRGEYYRIKPAAQHLCRNLIYPVPDPQFPFLGVHFTRMIDGSVECGPNAVLALAREGYRKTDFKASEFLESVTYPGFLRLAAKHWKVGCGEVWRSVNKAAFVKALQRLVPDLKSSDLEPAPAGVRAQAVAPGGKMVDDFVIQETGHIINVCNAPSPAATSSLSIGHMIIERLASHMA